MTWPTSALQVRAQAEPLLNAWAATLLPRPAHVRCRAAYVDPESGAPLHEMEVALTALDLRFHQQAQQSQNAQKSHQSAPQ